MKVALGIIIALVLALGVWLSLSLGQTVPQDTAPAPVQTTDALPQIYTDEEGRFSIRYPAGYTLESSGSDTRILIDPTIAAGTNLATDSQIGVTVIPPTQLGGPECSAGRFFDLGASNYGETITENGVAYSFASTNDAGAGNRYERHVYALKGSVPCIGVIYSVHYGAIGNYPEGQVKEFDRQALLRQFDSIRESLTLR